MTPEIDDLTCIHRTTTLAPLTPTLPMTATIRLASALHIDGAIVLDLEIEAAAWGNATPPHVVLPGARDEAQLLGADQGAQLE
jgi:hypothetical protein